MAEHLAIDCTSRTCAQHRDIWRHYEDVIAQNAELREQTRQQAEDTLAPEAPLDENRCAVCGWPLIEGDGLNPLGCVRGNCSQRPMPEPFYDRPRAERERYGASPEQGRKEQS